MRNKAALLAVLMPLTVAAEQPLSAIDWLKDPEMAEYSGPVLLEPPVSTSGREPEVRVSPLGSSIQPVGLVPPSSTGLPPDLWTGSDVMKLTRWIATAPVRDFTAMQRLLFTLLLTESNPPAAAKDAERLLLARLDRLIDLGAVDAARELVQSVGADKSAARFARWFDTSLLTGDEDKSCAVLTEKPALAPGLPARIFCAARGNDWQTAALILETARALELLPNAQLDLLDWFLHPDLFEDAAPMPVPRDPDPLTFRLFETIGERLPTSDLPRAFATADLRDVAGWKAQIEAAERLARIGALSPNQLLGLYTERQPAASGGVWTRVAAVQSFEAALNEGDDKAIANSLPLVWDAMRDIRLEVPFATLFAERLAQQDLTDPKAQMLAWRIQLLGPAYEEASHKPPYKTPETAFLAAVAQGTAGGIAAPGTMAQAIADGFARGEAPPDDLRRALDRGQLGEVILRTIVLFNTGAHGNPDAITGALATLRTVNLEDTARRAALQLMLLERVP
ncbi:hypothetical protein [Pontibaca salina]|uniref:Antifreeze glycopeptide polyprotein n=1 Tax=Pontibaca salina TaxID=2795731 RepID=A0A934LZW9_9RHOB|nr:hypothetical protein [Pontibaca salina]MBI6629128.1 hypothetical protein [Pontibaca salina]